MKIEPIAVPAYLQKYVDYIRNVTTGSGTAIMKISQFDEDWEPIGPMVRTDLEKRRLIEQEERLDGIAVALYVE